MIPDFCNHPFPWPTAQDLDGPFYPQKNGNVSSRICVGGGHVLDIVLTIKIKIKKIYQGLCVIFTILGGSGMGKIS